MLLRLASLAFATLSLVAAPAAAQGAYGVTPVGEQALEVPGLDRVRVDEHLDATIPRNLTFRDLSGRTVRLSDLVNGQKPVVLTFAYHSCPTLCSMVMDAVVRGLREINWTIGEEYEVITVSIDPHEDLAKARNKRRSLLEAYGRRQAANGWHFLVGDQDEIRALTDAVGYRYFYDSAQHQYAHPAAITILTPNGRIARYLYGLEFNPSDIRLGLLEASEGRSISSTEHFLLYCYAYDPSIKSYSLMARRVMMAGGVLIILALAAFLGTLWRRELKRARSGAVEARRFSPEASQVGT
ncbi:MAG: SCO family protein [Polyangiales bacterium]